MRLKRGSSTTKHCLCKQANTEHDCLARMIRCSWRIVCFFYSVRTTGDTSHGSIELSQICYKAWVLICSSHPTKIARDSNEHKNDVFG